MKRLEEEEEDEEQLARPPSHKILDFTKQLWFVHSDPKKVQLLFYLYIIPFGDGEELKTKCIGQVMRV
eukprot:c56670_g1_i1 orf=24-227(+)